jgi:hypothetical protein
MKTIATVRMVLAVVSFMVIDPPWMMDFDLFLGWVFNLSVLHFEFGTGQRKAHEG